MPKRCVFGGEYLCNPDDKNNVRANVVCHVLKATKSCEQRDVGLTLARASRN